MSPEVLKNIKAAVKMIKSKQGAIEEKNLKSIPVTWKNLELLKMVLEQCENELQKEGAK